MEKNKKQETIWNPAFISICLIGILLNISKQMSNSITSVYVNTLAGSATIVGLVSSAFSVSALLFKLFSGAALDTFNRRNILFIAMITLSISFFGYGLSKNVSTMVMFRFLQGAAQAFTAPCLLTMVSDALPSDRFGSGIGTFTLVEGIASAIGPTIGLRCVDLVGYNYTFFISSVTMLLSSFSVLLYRLPFKRTGRFRITLSSILSMKVLRFAVILFAFNFTNCVIQAFLVIFAQSKNINGNMGLYFTINAVALMLTRPLVGQLNDKYGVVKIAIPGMLAFILSFWIISFAQSFAAFIAAALVSAFGFGAVQPAIQALCMKCLPKEERGVASNTCYLAQDFGNLLGPVVGGLFAEKLGYGSMFRLMTIPIMLSVLYTILIRKRINTVEKDFLTA